MSLLSANCPLRDCGSSEMRRSITPIPKSWLGWRFIMERKIPKAEEAHSGQQHAIGWFGKYAAEDSIENSAALYKLTIQSFWMPPHCSSLSLVSCLLKMKESEARWMS